MQPLEIKTNNQVFQISILTKELICLTNINKNNINYVIWLDVALIEIIITIIDHNINDIYIFIYTIIFKLYIYIIVR